ncbi:hypothetical protein OHA72_03575 [Dactylosporangium sp. NBC_01737]|uniref:ComEC/Rec2 family competence protein n=1 Tax=Dactylosporangium sp. NBC_01737 TaxID=2975959 RepID=UPI002E0E7C4D|nr:hypothetical protein OHA72_03575 [Dactylosporangium sp. NBC_01737]
MSHAYLEIHVLNVSQGDSVLIINRNLDKVKARIASAKKANPTLTPPIEPIDWVPYAISQNINLTNTVKKALLIDGGTDGYGGNVLAYLLAHGAINPELEHQPLLSVMISHYHADHMDGLKSIVAKLNPAGKGLLPLYRPAVIYQPVFDGMKAAAGFVDLEKYFEIAATGKAATRGKSTKLVWVYPGGLTSMPQRIQVGSEIVKQGGESLVIDLGKTPDDLPITFTVIAAGQSVSGQENYTDVASKSAAIDQNDRSIVGVLEHGSFRAFFGGDIAGTGGDSGGNFGDQHMNTKLLPYEGNKKSFTSHANLETPVREAMEQRFPKTWMAQAGRPKFRHAGYVTLMKANHHGSNSSNDVHLLAQLRPTLFAVSCGFRTNFHGHPTQQVINRLASAQWSQAGSSEPVKNTIQQVYYTEVLDVIDKDDKKKTIEQFGVHLRGGKILGCIVIRPVHESLVKIQQAPNFGQELAVQVYGNAGFSDVPAAKALLPPAHPPQYGHIYPLGPWYHTDLH